MHASRSRLGTTPRDTFLATAAILVAALVAYQGSFSVPFFFDDQAAIKDNLTIRQLWRLDRVLAPPNDGGGMTGRPVVNLSLAINYALNGTNPRGYHVFNLFLHATAGLVLFGLVRRTFLQPVLRADFASTAAPLALAISLLWLLHPLQTESVTCVIQRTELLVGVFYLLTLYSFVRATDDNASGQWRWFAIACCALGMASKEVMVSAPLLVLLYDRTFVAGSFRAAWQKRRSLHLILAATWAVLLALLMHMGGTRGPAAGFGLGTSWWSYALKQCDAIVTYLKLSLWPHPLIVDYGTAIVTDPAQVAPQILIVLALIAATGVALRWRPAWGFVGVLFFAILAPSSSVVPLITQTMAEHRMYLPLAAVMVLLVLGFHRLAGPRTLPILGALALAMSVSTMARNRTLQDELVLWADNVAKIPTSARAHATYGLALSEHGRALEAIAHFKRALGLDPKSVATEQNIGNAYFQLGDFVAAASHYRRAVELDPKFASAYNNLGAALLEMGDAEGALRHYRIALDLDPKHVGAQQNAGRALFALGRFSESVAYYEQAQRLRPTSPDAHYDLGLALARAGDMSRAAAHLGEALRLRPNPASYLNYARFLANAGRIADAIVSLETALRLQPDFAEARRELEQLRNRR